MLFLKLKCSVSKIYLNKKSFVDSLDFGIPSKTFLGEVPKSIEGGKATKIFSFTPYNNIDIEEEIVKIGNDKEVVVKTNKDLPVWTNIEYQFRFNPNCSSGKYLISFELVSILNPQEYKDLKNQQ